MIQFSKFGNYGRLGNQLYQLAALDSFAHRYDTDYLIPKWSYSQYFVNYFPETSKLPSVDKIIKEPSYVYNQDYFDSFESDFKHQKVDLLGYFQNVKYFDPKRVKELFQLKPELIEKVRGKYLSIFKRPTIAIGVRRTDYENSPNYHHLPIAYYIQALQKFDYVNCNIVFISDDIEWCKFHFKGIDHSFFPEFETDIEQFAFGTLVTEGWIIANSTFHWWSAFLSNVKRVIQPKQLFAGKLLEKEGDNNFYIENEVFEIFDHGDRKIDLKDVTFIIPVSYDSNDRRQNLELTVCLLQKHFDTNIIVGEQGGNKFEYMSKYCKYVNFPYEKFHRTKMLNEMTQMSETPIISNWDADVMVAPAQIFQSVEWLRKDMAQFVYPYLFQFIRIPRNLRSKMFPSYDLAVYKDLNTGSDSIVRPSVGGAIFYNKQKFWEAGGENEGFVSYGPEDVERFERYSKLGYSVKRTYGDIYHFDHYIGVNSSFQNPDYKNNVKQLGKIRGFSRKELRKEVDKWSWANAYQPAYFDSIFDTKSRDEIFDVLFENNIVKEDDTVVDVGCAQGQWGVNIKSKYGLKYFGMDMNVPKENFKAEGTYINQDLREDFMVVPEQSYDLAICLEVAEHLEEEYAELLVKNLTKLSDQVLFSAAIPDQGGLRHLNEQWQSYWVELFKKHNYWLSVWQPRHSILQNRDIAYYYRQNILLFNRGTGIYGENLNGEHLLEPYLDYILPHNLRTNDQRNL